MRLRFEQQCEQCLLELAGCECAEGACRRGLQLAHDAVDELQPAAVWPGVAIELAVKRECVPQRVAEMMRQQ